MSKTFKRIMLVTNAPCDTDGAEKSAEYFAKFFGADVLLVDTLPTPFYPSMGPALSTEFAFELAVKSKQAYLLDVKKRFESSGIKADSKVFCSHRTSIELISAVKEKKCDLVIRYMKGRSSRAEGRYGETAQNLMRACPAPTLFAQEAVEDPKVLACINLEHSANENKSIIENARQLVSEPGKLFVLCCWQFGGSDIVFDHIDEGLVEQTREEAAEMYTTLFNRLIDDFDLADMGLRVALLNSAPTTAIPEFCSKNGIDVAVMCSASLNHPLGRSLGTTIERTIASLPCALMTVKPIGFQSPEATRLAAVSRHVPSN